MYKFQVRLGLCASAALVLWSAADVARSAPDSPAPQPAVGTPSAAPEPEARADAGSGVLVRFEGGQITVADMQAAIANKDARTRAHLASTAGRTRFLRELTRYDLLALEAERRGYAKHPEVIEAGKRAAIDTMLVHDLEVDPASISKQDVAQYFEAQRASHTRPPLRRASHIAVATEAEALELIAALRGATRERFAKLAVERSLDERSRRQGGELGYFDRQGKPNARTGHAVAPELAASAFAIGRVGQVAKQPVAHGAHYSVLMLTGEMPGIEPRLADLEEQLRQELAEQRFVKAQEDLLARLRQEIAPEVHAELVSAIALEAVGPLDQPQGFPAAPPDPRAAPKVVEPDGF